MHNDTWYFAWIWPLKLQQYHKFILQIANEIDKKKKHQKMHIPHLEQEGRLKRRNTLGGLEISIYSIK